MSRVAAVVRRHVLIHFKSPARLLDLFFWPVMELLVWGFFTVFLKNENVSGAARLTIQILNALIFWDILYRSQQAMSLAFMEELWTRNVLNLLVSPLKVWEWVAGAYLYGLIKTGIIIGVLFSLAIVLYAFDVSALGLYFAPLCLNLLLFGYAMGLLTTGLLLRWGHAAEALIWGVPFLVQPFSAIFYPLSVYPGWMRPIVMAIPSTHVMEAMRAVVATGRFPWTSFMAGMGLNLLATVLCSWFCLAMLKRGRASGQLVRMAG